MSVWLRAFEAATEVEKDGARFFTDLPEKTSKKRSRDDEAATAGPEDEEDEDGGFQQPKKLSQFAKRCLAGDISPTDGQSASLSQSSSAEDLSEPSAEDSEAAAAVAARAAADNLASQVCRIWLKHHYLQLGPKCKPDCPRKHEVTGKPESLYSDYSFKGLKAKQQKAILDAVRKERLSAAAGSHEE